MIGIKDCAHHFLDARHELCILARNRVHGVRLRNLDAPASPLAVDHDVAALPNALHGLCQAVEQELSLPGDPRAYLLCTPLLLLVDRVALLLPDPAIGMVSARLEVEKRRGGFWMRVGR